MKGILGTKVGMTQVWQGDRLIPVTVVLAGPCPVVQRKTPQTDGLQRRSARLDGKAIQKWRTSPSWATPKKLV